MRWPSRSILLFLPIVGCETCDETEDEQEADLEDDDAIELVDDAYDLEPGEVIGLELGLGASPFGNDLVPPAAHNTDLSLSATEPTGGTLTPRYDIYGPGGGWTYAAPTEPGTYTFTYTVAGTLENRASSGVDRANVESEDTATVTIRVIDAAWSPADDLFEAEAFGPSRVMFGMDADPLYGALVNDALFPELQAVVRLVEPPFGTLTMEHFSGTFVASEGRMPEGNQPTWHVATGGTAPPGGLGDWSWTYEPPDGISDRFTYEVCSFGWYGPPLACRTATVTIVGADGAAAYDDLFLVEDDAVAEVLRPLDNDVLLGRTFLIRDVTDPGGGPATFGTFEVANTLLYFTPPQDGETGDDVAEHTVVVTICDQDSPADCLSSDLTVQIVADAPVGTPDQATAAGGPSSIAVLDNDVFDRPYEDGSLAVVSAPTLGTATVAIGGDEVVYTANDPDQLGTDSFTYEALDRLGQSTGEVTVTVTLEGDPCAAVLDDEPDNDDPATAPFLGVSELYAGSSVRETIRLYPGEADYYTTDLRLYGTCAVDSIRVELAAGWTYDAVAMAWVPTGAAIGSGVVDWTLTYPGGASATASFTVGGSPSALPLYQEGFGLESYGIALTNPGSTCIAGVLLVTVSDCVP